MTHLCQHEWDQKWAWKKKKKWAWDQSWAVVWNETCYIASGKFVFNLKSATEGNSLSPGWTFLQRHPRPIFPLAISFPA